MSDRRNGLYYESMDIRNHVLSRNIGEYRGYKWSLLANGGLAIGMPYAVETELVPYTLAERSMEGLHLNTILTKGANPYINVAWREGGLFGYTHEVINSEFDWISRNQNLLRSFYDYESTEDVKRVLNEFPDTLPWGNTLRWYSEIDEPQSTEPFFIYPDYIKSMEVGGSLSFDKPLGENYLGRLLHMGFNRENTVENVGDFIDNYTGDITWSDDELLRRADTKLGYIGRLMLGEARKKQIDHNPWITNSDGVYQAYAELYNFNEDELSDKLSDSVDGFFKGAGVFDDAMLKSEHYDERDDALEGERNTLSNKISYNQEERLGIDIGHGFSAQEKSLLDKTKVLFDRHKIKTLIGRFHTSNDDYGSKDVSITQSALNPIYGISHGRNLLKLKPTVENGYDNPYCRVWTYHHQYSKMTDLIRPFVDEKGSFMSLENLQAGFPGRPIIHDPARGSWSDKTVLNKNGMVNIAPTWKIGTDDKLRVQAKQCMFSIENLAWKNVHNGDTSILDEGEIGPLGGRIMWFPPYNLQFNESVSVNWGSNDFIGRGERIYSYTNTERSGTLSFTILADHPSILDYWLKSDNRRNKPATEEDEQKVLRFFAGCGELEVDKDILNESSKVTTKELEERESAQNDPRDGQDNTVITPNETTEENLVPTPPDEFTKDNSIGFYVYFPNNLSCVDFMNNPQVGVNYLVNGRNGFFFNPELNGDENWTVDGEGIGALAIDTDIAIIGDQAKKIGMELPGYPGYEMGRGNLTEEEVADTIREHNMNKSNDEGRDYIWGYGVDSDKVKERLCGAHGSKGDKTYKLDWENYCDVTDYGLNRNPNPDDNACAYSFMDVAAAITSGYKYSGKGEVGTRVFEIRKILGLVNEDGSEPTKNKTGRKYFFSIAGGASVHGYQDKNTGLSQRRANFLRAWLEDCFKKLNLQVDYDKEAKIPVVTGIEGGEDSLDINSPSAKKGRYAKAVIFWNDEDVTDANEINEKYNEPSSGDVTVQNLIRENTMINQKMDENTAGESAALTETSSLRNASSTRYRDEEEFFSMLKEESPVIYKNIVDKVKYFDPIYHSITPEGFNARLSFLHQCTRQGPTMSSSDLSLSNGLNGAGYAGNLAFGRAPVCVLRLGDFYNTRIIINNIQIQYETNQWDLNPEGIGVQPMLANVTMGIVFQGGSSLGGPIQRLQNAVSFNYYANQEVYDDRADVAVYKNKEFSEKESLVWLPGYGNMNVGKVKTENDAKDPINETVMNNSKTATAVTEGTQQDINRKKAQEILEKYSIEVEEEEVEEEPLPTPTEG